MSRRIKQHQLYPDLRLWGNTATAIQIPTPRQGFGDLARAYPRRARVRHLEAALQHLRCSAPQISHPPVIASVCWHSRSKHVQEPKSPPLVHNPTKKMIPSHSHL